MIFAYSKFRGIYKGYAFRTHDGHLMEIFLGQFNENFNDETNRPVTQEDHLYPDVYKKIKAQKATEPKSM